MSNSDVSQAYADSSYSNAFGRPVSMTPSGVDYASTVADIANSIGEVLAAFRGTDAERLGYADSYDARAAQALRDSESAISRYVNPTAETIQQARAAGQVQADGLRAIGENIRGSIGGGVSEAARAAQIGEALRGLGFYIGAVLAVGQVAYHVYQVTQDETTIHEMMARIKGSRIKGSESFN